MPCCCAHPPKITINKAASYSASVIWNDNNICRFGHSRTIKWQFYKNGALVYATAYGAPSASLAIGTGSTYTYINATPQEITDFLISMGVTLVNGDKIGIQAIAKACDNEIAKSNIIVLRAVTSMDCDCHYSTAFDNTQTGNTAVLPGGFNAANGLLLWRDGRLNYAGLDFSANPILAGEELKFLTIAGCAANLDKVTVINQTGNVAIPSAFLALSSTEYLLFRNGSLQRAYTQGSGFVTPSGAASDPSDEWHFVRVAGSTMGCTFGSVLVGASVSGATFNLPSGYTSTNQSEWLLCINGIVMYLGSGSVWGYTVDGAGLVTLVTAAIGDEIWIVPIL